MGKRCGTGGTEAEPRQVGVNLELGVPGRGVAWAVLCGSGVESFICDESMNAEFPVTLRKISYRGAVVFHLAWEEGGGAREQTCENEEEAVVAMAQIEGRLRLAEMAGKGLTVNPFGEAKPFITSKDVHFAALRLQPRNLGFREAIQDYVGAVTALQGTDTGVVEAAKAYAEAERVLRPFDVSLEQAVFEWAELKRRLGERPIFELLRGAGDAEAEAAITEAAGTEPRPPGGA